MDADGRILLCQRSQTKKFAPGAWHMPGGGVDEGESIEDALRRELREELALELVDTPLNTGVVYTYDDPERTDEVRFYAARAANAPQLVNYENSAFVFVNEDEFPKYLSIARGDDVAAVLDVNLRAAAAARSILG